MLLGRFSRPGDHSRPISGHFGDFGPDPLSETSTSVLSQHNVDVSEVSIVAMSQKVGLALNRRKWLEMGPEWSPGLENPPK